MKAALRFGRYCSAALAAAAWVLARTLMPDDGWRGALLVLALVAALPASLMNVNNAQTNFILLLLVALALRDRAAEQVDEHHHQQDGQQQRGQQGLRVAGGKAQAAPGHGQGVRHERPPECVR